MASYLEYQSAKYDDMATIQRLVPNKAASTTFKLLLLSVLRVTKLIHA